MNAEEKAESLYQRLHSAYLLLDRAKDNLSMLNQRLHGSTPLTAESSNIERSLSGTVNDVLHLAEDISKRADILLSDIGEHPDAAKGNAGQKLVSAR